MTPKDIGQSVGYAIAIGLFTILPIVGIIFNALALRRRRTNAKCALSAIFSLGTLILAVIAGQLFKSPDLPPILRIVPSLLFVGCLLTALILAIIGLIEFSRRRRRYDRGRKRAIAALAMTALWFGVFCFGIYAGAKGRSGFGPSKVLTVSGQEIKNEDWNFRIRVPDGWAQVEAPAQNPLARAALLHRTPSLSSLVLAEDLSQMGGIRIDAAITAIKNNLKGGAEAEFVAEEDWNENGLAGRRLESLISKGPLHFFYVHSVTQNNGTCYQLVTWGAPENRDLARAESRKLASSFHLLDPKRATLAEGDRAPATFTSRKFGYTVDLSNTVWKRRWTTMAENVPAAEFGVENPTKTACFCIVPVWIGDDHLDFDILTHALAGLVGVPYPNEAVYGVRDFKAGPLEGRALAFERSSGGNDFLYRLRVYRGGGFAYLFATWMDKKSDSFSDFLDEGMDRVRFADHVDPDPLILDNQSRMAHGLAWNNIALALDRAGQTEAALPWAQKAYEADRTQAVMLGNYADLCLKANRPTDAITYLDKHLDRFPGNFALGAKRARAQFQAGDVDGALKSYGALFDGGWRDDGEFTGYIRELGTQEHHDVALAALDSYAKDRETPLLRRLRAEALQAAGRHDEAIAILTAARQEAPGDNETALALATAYFIAKRNPECIAECDRIITAHRESAEVYRRKGYAEFMLKRYREAKVSFEKAHDRDPANPEIKRILDHVSGLLGEGGNSTVKRAIEPVPSALAESPQPAVDPADPYLHGYSAWYRSASRAILLRKG